MNNRCFGRQIQAETADLGASLIRTLELLSQVIVDAEALAGAIEGGGITSCWWEGRVVRRSRRLNPEKADDIQR